MALPIALGVLAAMFGTRYGLREQQASRQDEAFQKALGRAPGPRVDPMTIGGEEAFGPPGPGTPGSGLRGAFQDDPQTLAILEAYGGLAGVPGTTPQDLTGGLGNLILGRSTAKQLQGQSLQEARTRMLMDQVFEMNERLGAQDFRSNERLGAQQFEKSERELREGYLYGMQQDEFAHLRSEGAADRNTQKWVAELKEKLGGGSGLNLGTNMFPYPAPGGAGVIPGPVPGSGEYSKGVETVQMSRRAVGRIDRLNELYLLGGQGREQFGANAGEQLALYNEIITDIGRGAKLGTLQKSDLERILSQYPSPDQFFAKLYQGDPWLNAIMGQLSKNARDEFQMSREMFPWTQAIPGIAGDLAPAPTPESVMEKNRGRKAGEAEKGRMQPLPGNPAPLAPAFEPESEG